MTAQRHPVEPEQTRRRHIPGLGNFMTLWLGAVLIWKGRKRRGAGLPDRPKLAPGVTLTGPMRESAFKNPPWMIERQDGTFVQVTPLLFKIAERCNGESTAEDIASQLTEAGTPIQPQTITRLVGQMLIPQGLVLTADGEVVHLRKHAASPLMLSMRMKMLNPELIEPITGILQYLYWPPLLIGILVVAAAVQWWVFFQHGIAGPIRDALDRPASMLVLLGIVVASAAFHEFGHAAGLRYGGGKVRGMGVGLYLIYPVVYTDVTDEYRLGRWGKVRTDLGGFYFNLIFASAVFAVYALTGQPFLLVSVLLTDLEIVQQLMPFTRLDGYWILADLTGIPDFFSMLIPFVRTELHLSGPHVPPLKLWARVVFAVYILVTGPLLALLLFLMVKSVPRVLATAWVSFSHQVHTFTSAQSTGNVAGMVLAVVAVIGLAIPTVGLFLVLYRFAKQGGGALWRWSAGSLPRRAVASAVSLGVSAGVIFLWLPQIPWSTNHGLLYSPAALRPIGPSERGTIHDAVPFLPGPAQGHVTRQRTSTSRTPQSKPPGTPRTAGGSQHGTTGSATGTPLPAVSTPGAPGAGTTTPTKGGASTPGAAPGRNSTPTPTSGGTRPPTPNPTTAPATSATSAPTEAPTEGSTQEQPTPTPVPQEQATPAATQGTQGQSSEQPTPTPAVPSTQGSQEEPTLEPQGTSSQSTQNASPSTSTDGQTSPTSSPAPPPPGATSQSNQLPSDQTTQGTTVGPAATTAGP